MSEWETVGAPAGPDDGWETVGAPKPKTDWARFKSLIPKLPFGPAVETATALGSGAVAGPLSGFAGMAGAMLPGPPGQGADWVNKTQEALTYTPESKGAQTLTHIAAWPGEKIAQGGDWVGGKVTDITGSPALGAGLNAAIQAAPMLVGAGVKKMLPTGATEGEWAARNAERVKNASTDAAAARAREADFTLPPTQVSPGFPNSVLEWYAGKPQTAQVISAKNQPKLQDKVRGDFEALKGTPAAELGKETYDFVRSEAGKAYEAVKNTGESVVSNSFMDALDNMAAPLEKRAKYYPKDAPPPILAEIKSVNQSIINADAAVEKIKDLRNEANKAGSGERPDKALAGQYRDLAKILEDELERHLDQPHLPPQLLSDFRDARKTIAKSYTAEKYTKPSGEIDAAAMAREKKKGLVEGGMFDVADFGANFPRSAQMPSRMGGGPSSAFEAIGSVLHPKVSVLSAILGRHKLRDLLASDAYQKRYVNPPDYGPTMGDAMVRGLSEPGTAAVTASLGQQDEARKRAMLQQLLR